jgi:hypothetical protein
MKVQENIISNLLTFSVSPPSTKITFILNCFKGRFFVWHSFAALEQKETSDIVAKSEISILHQSHIIKVP